MPSISTQSSFSSRTGLSHSLLSSGSYDAFGLDALEEQNYLEELLDRCVPTWSRMLEKFERVVWLDRETSRLENAVIQSVGMVMTQQKQVGLLPSIRELGRAAMGRIDGGRGGRCRRSNSESLMTEIRAKQIREALSSELAEGGQNNRIPDVETPMFGSKPKSMSFTEGGVGSGPVRAAGSWSNMAAGVVKVMENRGTPGRTENTPISARPPLRPRSFVTSAGPRQGSGPGRRGSHELSPGPRRGSKDGGLGDTRRGSGAGQLTDGESLAARILSAENKQQQQQGDSERYSSVKLSGRDGKPPLPYPTPVRRPTSERSERVKRNPILPLTKHE